MTEIPSTNNDHEDEATLAIVLDGPGVLLGTIAAGTVSRYIDALRLGLQAIVELSDSATLSGTESQGRRQHWVKRIAAIRLVGIESGSVRIRFAEPACNGLFADSENDPMKLFRYRKPSVKTMLGVTKAKKRLKKQLGITAAMKPFRWTTNQKRRLKRRIGYESRAGRMLRHGPPRPGGCVLLFAVGPVCVVGTTTAFLWMIT